MRFIQTCATPYLLTTTAVDSGTICINQFTGTSTSAGNALTVGGNTLLAPPTNTTFTNVTGTVPNPSAEYAQVRMSQGRSVQNYAAGSLITRQGGV